jgi:hypothetical protein
MLPRNQFNQLELVRGGNFAGEGRYASTPNNALAIDRMQM